MVENKGSNKGASFYLGATTRTTQPTYLLTESLNCLVLQEIFRRLKLLLVCHAAADFCKTLQQPLPRL